MRADAIKLLLATVDTMQSATYADPHLREIHPVDLPTLLGISSQEVQLILGEAVAAGLLSIHVTGAITLTVLGRNELAQSEVLATSTPGLCYLGSDI